VYNAGIILLVLVTVILVAVGYVAY